MAAKKPCKQPDCNAAKDSPSHFCYWHRVARLLIDDQIAEAKDRLKLVAARDGYTYRQSVPGDQWPDGKRFCSGCQCMIPRWYADGSRCKACASESRYGSHILETYKITYDFYLALYQFQGGRCYICRKIPRSRRLAVDHDHETGQVRGLLCSGQRSCNHDVLGNITGVDMAKRIVLYLTDPPAKVMTEGRELDIEVASASGGMMAGKSRVNPEAAQGGTGWYAVLEKSRAQKIEAKARGAWEGHYSDKEFWRFPDGHEGPNDIFHAVPDRLEPEVWAKRLELAQERLDKIAAQRARQQG